MRAKRRGRPIHGWAVVDKPRGWSSARAVARVRRVTGAAKAGHAGTLDPLATGVLPIALGEATKTVAWVMEGSKIYRFAIRWGEARATDDAEGEVTARSPARPGDGELCAAAEAFTGHVEQVPPAYSARKLGGVRAYALARADAPVRLVPRRVWIESLRLLSRPDADHAIFELRCGKGTYVRSLARDIALRLGTVGHAVDIRRLAAGPFAESDAISLANLETLLHTAPPESCLLAVEAALDGIPALSLDETRAAQLRRGRPVGAEGSGRDPAGAAGLVEGRVLCVMAAGCPVAIARFEGGEIRPLRVLNL